MSAFADQALSPYPFLALLLCKLMYHPVHIYRAVCFCLQHHERGPDTEKMADKVIGIGLQTLRYSCIVENTGKHMKIEVSSIFKYCGSGSMWSIQNKHIGLIPFSRPGDYLEKNDVINPCVQQPLTTCSSPLYHVLMLIVTCPLHYNTWILAPDSAKFSWSKKLLKTTAIYRAALC